MRPVDVIRKIIGPIDPVGETHEDEKRFENLKTFCETLDIMLEDLNKVSKNISHYESSRIKAGTRADEFLEETKNWIDLERNP